MNLPVLLISILGYLATAGVTAEMVVPTLATMSASEDPWTAGRKNEQVCLATEEAPDPCKAGFRLDAAFTVLGETFLVKDGFYWRRSSGLSLTGPHLLNSTWPCSPSKIDAAFTAKQDGRTYFFRSGQVWKYYGAHLEPGYPKLISEVFPGIPNDVNAAVVWGGNQKIYFFKEFYYWRFDMVTKQTLPQISIAKEWRWFPLFTAIDAAVQFTNGRTMLFSGDKYWAYDDAANKILWTNPGYPRTTGSYWFNCDLLI